MKSALAVFAFIVVTLFLIVLGFYLLATGTPIVGSTMIILLGLFMAALGALYFNEPKPYKKKAPRDKQGAITTFLSNQVGAVPAQAEKDF